MGGLVGIPRWCMLFISIHLHLDKQFELANTQIIWLQFDTGIVCNILFQILEVVPSLSTGHINCSDVTNPCRSIWSNCRFVKHLGWLLISSRYQYNPTSPQVHSEANFLTYFQITDLANRQDSLHLPGRKSTLSMGYDDLVYSVSSTLAKTKE